MQRRSGPDGPSVAYQNFLTILGNDLYSIGQGIGKVQDGDSLFNFIAQLVTLKVRFSGLNIIFSLVFCG